MVMTGWTPGMRLAGMMARACPRIVTVVTVVVRVTVTVGSSTNQPPFCCSRVAASSRPAAAVPPTTRVVCSAWLAALRAAKSPIAHRPSWRSRPTISISIGAPRANSTAAEPRSSRRDRRCPVRGLPVSGLLEDPALDDICQPALEGGDDAEDDHGAAADADGVLHGVTAAVGLGPQPVHPLAQAEAEQGQQGRQSCGDHG